MSKSRRALRWALLLLLVVLAHLMGSVWVQQQLGDLDGLGKSPQQPRLEVAFVRALAPAAPAAAPAVRAATAAPKPRGARVAAPAASAASAPVAAHRPDSPASPFDVADARTPEPVLPELLPTPAAAPSDAVATAAEAERASALAQTASAAATATSAVAAAPPFEWPPSTRLTYALKGHYRGEVNGNARVQWIRQGTRYQVHLDVAIGPSFAPLMSRRMTSDGELGPEGLKPRTYDETTRLPFQQPRHSNVQFGAERVTLVNGSQHDTAAGIQDSASQFVQLTYLFTTQPEKMRVGDSVTLPVALPRRVGRWVYDIVGRERLATPLGELDTLHLKPRLGERRPGNELSAEVWFAPSLQYLPVRIRIQQDAETFVDLQLDAAPLQASEAPPR